MFVVVVVCLTRPGMPKYYFFRLSLLDLTFKNELIALKNKAAEAHSLYLSHVRTHEFIDGVDFECVRLVSAFHLSGERTHIL